MSNFPRNAAKIYYFLQKARCEVSNFMCPETVKLKADIIKEKEGDGGEVKALFKEKERSKALAVVILKNDCETATFPQQSHPSQA